MNALASLEKEVIWANESAAQFPQGTKAFKCLRKD